MNVVATLGASLGLLTLVTFSLEASLLKLHWCYLLTECLQPLLLIGYFLLRKVHLSTWGGFSVRGLSDWTGIMLTGLPSCGLIILEWGMYEVFVLILGSKSPEFKSVNAVGFTVVCISYLLQFGISVSATTHISQCIASGNVDDARKYIRSTIFSSLMLALLLVLAGLAGKNVLSLVFETSLYLDELTPWVVAYIFLDSYQIVVNGILRGCNKHILPMTVTVSSFVIALVTGAVLLLKPRLIVPSVWIGLCIGGGLCAVVLTVILHYTKFDVDSSNVLYRAQTDSDTVVLVADAYTMVNPNHVDSVSEKNAGSANGTNSGDGSYHSDNSSFPIVLDRCDVQHLLLTKGTLFLLGFILVCTAAGVNMSYPQF